MAFFAVHLAYQQRVLEGMNSLIQAAKANSRGYRTVENLITMSYLIAGQRRFNVPHFR